IPMPLSARRNKRRPPASTSSRNSVAPASSEFSSSSLTTLAGRSTTSPAAILLATLSERTRMRPIRREAYPSAAVKMESTARRPPNNKGISCPAPYVSARLSVFEAQLFLVQHLGSGVGRREDFDDDLGCAEKIVFCSIPTTLRNESYIRNPILMFRDRPESDFFFHNA